MTFPHERYRFIKLESVAMGRPDRAITRVQPMSALGQKRTSSALGIYVRFWGLSGHPKVTVGISQFEMSAFGGKADSLPDPSACPLIAISGRSVVPVHAAGKAGEGRCQGCPSRTVRHVPACRGGDSTTAVRRNPATDRRPATKARADMTPCVIAEAGLNRRVPGSRCLPNDRFLASDCVSARSRMHRAAHPKTPNRVVR